MLQVCLNGARSPREHFHLPVHPEELAKAAADAVAAGATDIHLHPKAPDGTDSLDPHLVAATLRAVRAAAPGTPVGVTTGAWTAPDAAARIQAIRAWTVLPDHASVNWHEPGADDIAATLLERGIGVEAGIYSGTDADQQFHRSPHRGRVLRILAEVTDHTARGAATTAEALLTRLRPAPAPILLHGEAAGAWPVLAVAARRGLATRIGLEDTLALPDGQIAADNAELVTAATTMLTGGAA
ncbi:3-keto-5-aminohexanoate cleavage protein [Saccharopolyspora sp. NPDC000359]|uniref:3-keto-5-aminohexanoate cleavage protein n=1 Tax=Saccharopolyspora sp. NPDC000359 TaxID=3154251 RepID=UPI00332FF8FB